MATAQLTAVIDTKGAAKAERELNSISKKAKVVDINVNKAGKSIKSFGQNASKAAAAIDGPLGGVASRISAITSLASSGAVAFSVLGAAIAGAGFATVAGVKALDEYNVSLKRVEATIKATGEGVGFTGEQLQRTAEELAIATLTSVDAVQRAQAQLLTFNRVLGAEFTKSIELSQDLAEAGFGTIESNAVLLGKALQDPIKGISALSRVGVTLSENQKELARNAAEVGDVFEAQRIVLAAVASQVEGVGAAVASGTLAGELDSAGIAIDRFTRAFTESSGALDIWQQIVRGVGVTANDLAAALEGPTSDDLFAKSLESSLKLSDAQTKLNSILDETSSQYRRQEKVVARLRQENQEAIRLASEAAEIDNKRIIAQGQAQLKEVEARKRITEELKTEADKKASEDAIKLQEKLDREFEITKKAYVREYELSKKAEARIAADKKKVEEQKARDAGDAGDQSVADLKTILGEQSGLYKAAAITQTTISTYSSAVKSYDALAGIPVVGPALGFAAAGLAVTAGLANVAQISAAREQGGSISAGQNVLVGERGPEIITSQTNARVLNNKQTSAAMNGGGSTEVSLVVIDQSTGAKQFDQEQQDDGRIVLLIRDTVAGDAQNANSQIRKSFGSATNLVSAR